MKDPATVKYKMTIKTKRSIQQLFRFRKDSNGAHLYDDRARIIISTVLMLVMLVEESQRLGSNGLLPLVLVVLESYRKHSSFSVPVMRN